MDRKHSRCMRGSGSTSAGDPKGFFPEEERAREKLFQLGNDLKSTLSEIFSAQRKELTNLKKENKRLKGKVFKMEIELGIKMEKKKTALETKLDAFRYKLKKKDVVLAALRNELKGKDVVLASLKEELKRKDELLQKDGNADDDDVQELMKERYADYEDDDQELKKDRNAVYDADVQEWMKRRNANYNAGVQEWMKHRNADDDDDDDDVQEWTKEGNADGDNDDDDDDDAVQELMKDRNADDDDDDDADDIEEALKEGNADDNNDDDDDAMKDRNADDVQEVMKEGNADEDDVQPSAKINRAAFKEELKQILIKKSMSAKWRVLSLNDPQWQPFKTVPIKGTDKHEEILDLDNGRIAMLRLQLGDEADSILLAAFDAAKHNHGQHSKSK